MIILLNLKEDSFTYQGELHTRSFPLEYLLCMDEQTQTILGYAKIDLLENTLLETRGDNADVEHNLYLLAIHRFLEMGERYMMDKRKALVQRVDLEQPGHHLCK